MSIFPARKDINLKKLSYKKISVLFFNNIFSIITFIFGTIAIFFAIGIAYSPVNKLVSPIVDSLSPLKPLKQTKKGHEVFGFAPYWTIGKLNNIDFSSLTTFAYFSIPVLSDGSLDRTSQGYQTFKSDNATKIFRKAHANGTRVVLTTTIMDNNSIEQFLDSDESQKEAINQIIYEVKDRGIDGVNIDMEYVGDPGQYYQDRFSNFTVNLSREMHKQLAGSKVTVSVYASSAKDPKMHNIASLAANTDGIFMMAYDFATTGSDTAVPTSPLYGYKQGKYNYDISTAVEDFLKVMPADKLILGVPYYGYNYLIYGEPKVDADTMPSWSWLGSAFAQTYSKANSEINPERTGWDNIGKVGWKAYFDSESGTWRMIFLEDEKSLAIKYDFIKDKNLAGVGIWALGFDEGKPELWNLIKEKFGTKNLADSSIRLGQIN